MIKDDGSNYDFGVDNPVADVPKSGFNLSYVNSTTMIEGQIIPTWFEYTIPQDQITYSNESLVRVLNTPNVPLASRQRLFHHTYFTTLSRLWVDFEPFMTRGYSMTDYNSLKSMVIPTLTLPASCFGPGTLMDNLGFVGDINSQSYITIPAFKPMMYLRIIRDNYINKRIYATWLDYLIAHPPVGDNINYQFVKNFMFAPNDEQFRIGTKAWDDLMTVTATYTQTNKDATLTYLFGRIWYRDWTQDYFTSALTVPEFGETVTNNVVGDITFSANHLGTKSGTGNNIGYVTGLGTDSYLGVSGAVSDSITDNIAKALNTSLKGTVTAKLTMNALRNLACGSAIMEKMAKMDGSFSDFGLGFFGCRASDTRNFNATYISGSYIPIQFADVINVASSQGDISGRGFAGGRNEGSTFFSDNYGIAMTLSMVMPDTYYTQGMHRQDLFTSCDDFYLPERAKLGMDAIFGAELYNKFGDNANNTTVFGYQNRFDYMRYRYNECHGAVSDPSKHSYSPYIEKRIFSSLPNLEPSFLTTEGNIAGEWRSSVSDPDYFVQILNDVRALRCVPYKAVENNLGF